MTTQVPLFAAAPADFPTAGYTPSTMGETLVEAHALPPQNAPPPNWEDETIIVSLTLRAPGQTKQVKGVDVTKRQRTMGPDGITPAPAADPEELKVDKYLYEAAEFDAVVSHQAKTRDWLKARCVPSKLLKSGLYRVAVGLVNDIEAHLVTARAIMADTLLPALVHALPAVIEDRRRKLGELFDPDDYPTPASLAEGFKIEWGYITVGVPEQQLASVNMALAQRMKDEAAQRIATEADEIVAALRQECMSLCGKIVERLTPDADGKRKIFKDSLTENLGEWLDLIQARNVTGDSALTAAAARARQALTGIDSQDLRDSSRLRSRVAEQFQAIEQDLQATPKPARAISFQEV